MAASSKIRTKSLKSAKFQFQLCLTTLDVMGSPYIVTNTEKCLRLLSIHIATHTSKHLK